MHKHLQFDSLCDRIRAAYSSLGHHMSWSFLYTSQSTLHSSQQLLFIGLNPGGKEGEKYTETPSCKDGNDYLRGDWDQKKWKKGKAPLQVQVQKLFTKIATSMAASIPYQAMMDASLAANYVPFRSSRWASLGNKELTLDFARKLWSEILDYVQPRAIICIAYVAYDEIKTILQSKDFQVVGSEDRKTIGWGNATYCLTELSDGERTVILVRLPHLSTYKVFSSTKCEIEIKKLIDKIASVLDADAF